MKRSEMVKIIASEIYRGFIYGKTIIDDESIQLADALLSVLEYKGMLPPLREKMENGRFVSFSSALYPQWEDEE